MVLSLLFQIRASDFAASNIILTLLDHLFYGLVKHVGRVCSNAVGQAIVALSNGDGLLRRFIEWQTLDFIFNHQVAVFRFQDFLSVRSTSSRPTFMVNFDIALYL